MTEELLAVFFDKLVRHDWFYIYSDSGPVFRAGEAAQKRLLNEASEHPATKELFEQYKNYVFKNGVKPARPTGEKPIKMHVTEFGF